MTKIRINTENNDNYLNLQKSHLHRMKQHNLQINIEKIISERIPEKKKYIPGFFIRLIERLICQKKLNELLMANADKEGVDFSIGILDTLRISTEIHGEDNLPPQDNASDWRVIFVSNHPLGGLDGMSIIRLIGEKSHSRSVRFIVNDLLMNIPPLKGIFLPVNTLSGNQTRSAAQLLDESFSSSEPIAIFPAGLCSRLIDGKIQDLKWNKMFINKAIKYQRDIIPLHFEGLNSVFFYKFAKLRKLLRIPFNIEMALLPREIFRNEQSKFKITVGKRISWRELRGGPDADSSAKKIRHYVYSLPNLG